MSQATRLFNVPITHIIFPACGIYFRDLADRLTIVDAYTRSGKRQHRVPATTLITLMPHSLLLRKKKPCCTAAYTQQYRILRERTLSIPSVSIDKKLDAYKVALITLE